LAGKSKTKVPDMKEHIRQQLRIMQATCLIAEGKLRGTMSQTPAQLMP
jgi:hypothetical protein